MPVMPRLNTKATKIAFKILGVPANFKKDKPKKDKPRGVIKTEVTFEDSDRLNNKIY
jgi:hypothetical protein